jgi:hypothetical protein
VNRRSRIDVWRRHGAGGEGGRTGCCLIIGVLAASPRIILFGLWLFTDYLSRIGLPFIWGFVGWIFVPCTTIAYAIAENSFGGLQGWGTVVFAAGIALDILLYASGRRGQRARRD